MPEKFFLWNEFSIKQFELSKSLESLQVHCNIVRLIACNTEIRKENFRLPVPFSWKKNVFYFHNQIRSFDKFQYFCLLVGFGETQVPLCGEIWWSRVRLPLRQEPSQTWRELVHYMWHQVPQPSGVYSHCVRSLYVWIGLLLAASCVLWLTTIWIWLKIIRIQPQTIWIWPKITRPQRKEKRNQAAIRV